MPVGAGKYRVVTRGGTKVRLHFTPGGAVNEAKNLKTGATHTPAEFRADRAEDDAHGEARAVMDLEKIKRAGELLDKATAPRGHRLLFDVDEGRLVCECGASCAVNESMEHKK